MDKKITTIGNIETFQSVTFHYGIAPIFLEDVDTDKILLSNQVSSSKENY